MPETDDEMTLWDRIRVLFWPAYYCPACGKVMFKMARSCRPVSGYARCTQCGTLIVYGEDGKKAQKILTEEMFSDDEA